METAELEAIESSTYSILYHCCTFSHEQLILLCLPITMLPSFSSLSALNAVANALEQGTRGIKQDTFLDSVALAQIQGHANKILRLCAALQFGDCRDQEDVLTREFENPTLDEVLATLIEIMRQTRNRTGATMQSLSSSNRDGSIGKITIKLVAMPLISD